MTFFLGSLFGVTHTSMESADINWLWVLVLIFRGMHAFELQNPRDKAVEGKIVP